MTVNVSIPDRFPIRDMLKFDHRHRSLLTVIDGDMKNILAIRSLEMTDNLMNRSAVLVRQRLHQAEPEEPVDGTQVRLPLVGKAIVVSKTPHLGVIGCDDGQIGAVRQ